MNQTVTFATSIRVKAALCCSVAILLTACGGTADEASQQPLAGMTAGDILEGSSASATDAVNAGAATPDSVAQETTAQEPVAQAVAGAAAPVAPGLPGTPPSTDTGMANAAANAPAAGGPAPATNEFNLSGYQDNTAASSSDAATQGTTAPSGADSQQATQLPAA